MDKESTGGHELVSRYKKMLYIPVTATPWMSDIFQKG